MGVICPYIITGDQLVGNNYLVKRLARVCRPYSRLRSWFAIVVDSTRWMSHVRRCRRTQSSRNPNFSTRHDYAITRLRVSVPVSPTPAPGSRTASWMMRDQWRETIFSYPLYTDYHSSLWRNFSSFIRVVLIRSNLFLQREGSDGDSDRWYLI